MRIIQPSYALYPSLWYWSDVSFYAKTVSGAADRYTALSPNALQIDIGGVSYTLATQSTLDLSVEATWDTIAGTDYRTAANRAGKDFYIYARRPTSGIAPIFEVSANATTPSGYSASTSRKVGGFHCLCVDVGAITSHPLTGYLAGDILPMSVWDLNNRAESENEGMVLSNGISMWVDIYLFSGTGTSTTSVNGASYADTILQYAAVDYALIAKKRLLFDHEFTHIALGCQEGVNVNGNSEQNTTGGHVSTGSKRLISNIGCEDCAGVIYQWLNDSLTSDDGTVSWDWSYVTGYTGSIYHQGTYGYYKMTAGGPWDGGANCGSRCRNLNHNIYNSATNIGVRAVSPKRKRLF